MQVSIHDNMHFRANLLCTMSAGYVDVTLIALYTGHIQFCIFVHTIIVVVSYVNVCSDVNLLYTCPFVSPHVTFSCPSYIICSV